MTFDCPKLTLIILSVIYFLKRWAGENQTSLAIIGLFFYFIGSLGWMLSLKFDFLHKKSALP